MIPKEGRYAEIVPKNLSHYVVIDGVDWARFDELSKAEELRAAIVARWAREYEQRSARYVTLAARPGDEFCENV